MNAVRIVVLCSASLWLGSCMPDPSADPLACTTASSTAGVDPSCPPADLPARPDPTPVSCSEQAVWISELHVDPPGPDGDGRDEFVELQTVAHADLDGWSVVFVDGASDRVYMRVSLLGRADAVGRFVVGGANVTGAQAFPPGTIQNGPDAVQVVDCHNRLFDELGYGSAPANSLIQRWVPRAPQGQSVHACATDVPGPAHTFVHGAPTADASPPPHPACGDAMTNPTPRDPLQDDPALSPTPPSCDPTPGIRLSEVYYDAVGVDAGHEFVEFAGPVGASLAGWWVDAIDGRTGTSYRAFGLADLVADSNGLALLHDHEGFRLGLQNGPDALVLRTCDGEAHDALVYGRFTADDTALDPRWGASVGAAAAGSSWSRCPQDAAAFVTGTPTPGVPNDRQELGGCRTSDALPVPQDPDADAADSGTLDTQADSPEPGLDLGPDATEVSTDSHPSDVTPRDTALDLPPELPGLDCLCEGGCAHDPRRAVRIDELFVDPEGADDPQVEFVELTGLPDTRLDGLTLVAINGANDATYIEVSLDGYRLDANGRLVVGGHANGLRGPALPTTLQNGPDAVAIQVCGGAYQSGVSYGRHTRPPNFPDVVVSTPPAGSSMQRCPDRGTSPRFVRASPTPGGPPADLAAACAAP